jgi:hypothetical protein
MGWSRDNRAAIIISKLLMKFTTLGQASKRDRDRRDKPRGIAGDRDGIGMENSEP